MEEGPFDDGEFAPLMAALPAYESFLKGTLLEHRADLTKTQMAVLVGLRYAGKMGMSQVAEHLAVSKEQASRAVGPLVEKGLVERSRNPENYRVVEVDLTERGREFLTASREGVDRDVAAKLAPLSAGDRARLLEASRTAAEILLKLQPGRMAVPPLSD